MVHIQHWALSRNSTHDTQCAFIRHCIEMHNTHDVRAYARHRYRVSRQNLVSCIVCTSRNTMASIRPTAHVHKTFVFASCVLCTSCNQMASIRQILRIRLDIVRTVHVAKTRWCPYDTSLCRETRWRLYDTQCTFIRHYVSASCIVCTSRNLMSPIPHAVGVYMTYVFASSVIHNSLADMRDTVHVRTTYDFATCVLCTSRNQMTFKRH